jgi:hypothetical protein
MVVHWLREYELPEQSDVQHKKVRAGAPREAGSAVVVVVFVACIVKR